jgi:hypothetical protein
MVSGWRVAAAVGCLGAALALKGDAGAGRRLPLRVGAAPTVMLWAWEEPEDLRLLDTRRAGVAFLADRVFLGQDVLVVPRRQSIHVPEGIWAEAVVRIETRSGFKDTEKLRSETAQAVLRAAALEKIRGVQVDFDATASQRAFYADVLRRVRAGLPRGLQLSMTALVSWCDASVADGAKVDWLRGLPVDSAVAMYFRLGPLKGQWQVHEPLCAGAVGVSTDEAALALQRIGPELQAGGHVYLFAPRPWTQQQIAVVNGGGFPEDRNHERVGR